MILFNGTKLDITKFPNKEVKIRRPWNSMSICSIELKWESDEDFIHLMFLKEHLDNYRMYKKIFLTIYYMPYSRMDRSMGGDIFTLKTMCKFINSLNFDEVVVHEPHSDVTPALLDRCTVINTSMSLLKLAKKKWDIDYLFLPDAGAVKRYHQEDFHELVGFKHRDPDTGRITKHDVIGNQSLEGKTVCIIDDLSSYGGTFVLAAEQLKLLNAGDIYLIVTHAEESILKGKVFDGNIKKVLTTNSIIDITHSTEQLEIIDISTI